MAHPEQLDFVDRVRAAFPDSFNSKRVLEIGSLDINGGVRSRFSNCDYTGIDVAPGPGVDLVCQGQDYDGPDASFDSVICCEVMEHNPYWRETFLNMFRICRPGGMVLMTCATFGRKEHGTTRSEAGYSPLTVGLGWEYYRNLTGRDFRRAIDFGEWVTSFGFFRNWKSADLYFVGFRRGAPPPPQAGRALTGMRLHYLRACAASSPAYFKMRLLMALVGEERYWAGPVRLW